MTRREEAIRQYTEWSRQNFPGMVLGGVHRDYITRAAGKDARDWRRFRLRRMPRIKALKRYICNLPSADFFKDNPGIKIGYIQSVAAEILSS